MDFGHGIEQASHVCPQLRLFESRRPSIVRAQLENAVEGIGGFFLMLAEPIDEIDQAIVETVLALGLIPVNVGNRSNVVKRAF